MLDCWFYFCLVVEMYLLMIDCVLFMKLLNCVF